ncbi:MAG: hypothetical protein UX25_C0003G0003 [Candidatus Woesebacteria bacterium GW2011_GWC2_45_9]|uniref:Uncharacterized protein n=1 Tax=Candidatus Woesebacteria bacterium GW2011_GWC2_45_9 TaxID=1618589 RepID=A0A0G1NBF5_9BACT|nr:MAG: hypothetical protein UX25_C0003G0003 [Candidatus Woesebacteria bacterium GW2011_GWC2_45_9]
MERKRGLFRSTIKLISSLWDGDERPTELEAQPVNDSEDQVRVRFVVKGNEHQQIIGADSDQLKVPSS